MRAAHVQPAPEGLQSVSSLDPTPVTEGGGKPQKGKGGTPFLDRLCRPLDPTAAPTNPATPVPELPQLPLACPGPSSFFF